MPSGGARARSGPPVNPNSARSDARGVAFRQLGGVPATAPVPEFAMPPMQLWETLPNGGRRFRKLATELRWKRELELWAWAWRQPQSEVWREQPWMTYNVAQWVRLAVTRKKARRLATKLRSCAWQTRSASRPLAWR